MSRIVNGIALFDLLATTGWEREQRKKTKTNAFKTKKKTKNQNIQYVGNLSIAAMLAVT